MSTATAPAGMAAPIDLVKELYGTPAATPAEPQPEQPITSAPNAENSAASAPKEPEAPAAEVKVEAPKGAEPEKVVNHEENHQKAARRLGKQVRELETKMDAIAEENRTLKAKLDGTYEEPQGPTPEQIHARAMFEGRELASRELANQKYGEERVHERIYAKDSELQQLLSTEPWAQHRIAVSQQPTLEAWHILEEHSFKQKYGSDPSEWKAKILAESRPLIIEEFKKTLHAPPTGAPAPSVTQARGDGGPSQQPKTLAQLMYGAPARA